MQTQSYDDAYETTLALVGLAGRFPGARSVDDFWHNLTQGKKSIRTFTTDELLAAGLDPALLARPGYVKSGALLEEVELFDAAFFGYTPREAEILDPQHRLFLECSWEALEQAGYHPDHYAGQVGIFAGSGFSTYGINNLYTNPSIIEALGEFHVNLSNEHDSLASMVAYKLNLHGPALSVQTFCSSSLVSIHLACQSLLVYECDMALAGGAAISVPQISGYQYEEGGILSPDGECRTFDAQAQGSVMGSGVGVVVLKRLASALKDGDQIYALIRGSAVNNDGAQRVSYTAPGLTGQANVITEALSNANLAADTISYIEAHGTATARGDEIELAAMLKAFGQETQKKNFCAIGSVKPNIGHLDRASGVTGFIKAALALHHQQIPPQLNFTAPPPHIALAESAFYIPTTLQSWPATNHPHRAGVSSFGLGGTNAHVILEAAPTRRATSPPHAHVLLILSAKTPGALKKQASNLANHLRQHPEQTLTDVAYTLQVGRAEWNYRTTVIGTNHAEASAELAHFALASTTLPEQFLRQRELVLFFPGESVFDQQWLQTLYQKMPEFRTEVERLLVLAHPVLAPASHMALRSAWSTGSTEPLTHEQRCLLIFLAEYALAQLLQKSAMAPAQQSLYGYGTGEYTALCVAGLLSFEEALLLITHQRPGPPARPYASTSTTYHSSVTGAQMTETTWLKQDFWSSIEHPPLSLSTVLTQLQAQQSILPSVFLFLNPRHLLPPTSNSLSIVALETEIRSLPVLLLSLLGKLWLAGVSVDWMQLYLGEERLRVPLPTYPFERKRYWIDPPLLLKRQADYKAKQLQPATGKFADLRQWLYQPLWQEKPWPAQALQALQAQPRTAWLLFVDECGIGEKLAQHLTQAGDSVLKVYAGRQRTDPAHDTVTIRPQEAEDYHRLCQYWLANTSHPRQIIHGWSITPEQVQPTLAEQQQQFQAQQQIGFYSLLSLAQALSTQFHAQTMPIRVLSTLLQAVEPGEWLQLGKQTLAGACKVIPQEQTHLRVQSIDIRLAHNQHESVALLQALTNELSHPIEDVTLAYRTGRRLTQHYEHIVASEKPAQEQPLRPHGVYLLTGGLGQIARQINNYLARTLQARLALIIHTPLPARAAWSQWLVQHEQDNHTSKLIQHILELESLGAEVLLLLADVTQEQQVEQAIQETYRRFGTLHGVFHTAGCSDPAAFKTLDALDQATCELHFQPKIAGLYTLEKVLQGRQLDFCLLFSSLSAILGGLGFASYSAANLFMDAFASQKNLQAGQRWISVNWDSWQNEVETHGVLGKTVAAYTMQTSEALAILHTVLSSRHTHVIISTGDLSQRLQQWIQLNAIHSAPEATLPVVASTSVPPSLVPSAELRANYAQHMRRIWQEVLGLKQVNPYENFFDLGGNSLTGLQVLSLLRKTLQRSIPIVALFEAPTISKLVEYLLPPQAPEAIGTTAEPAPTKRLEQRRAAARHSNQSEIAIIGMAGRFPGATSIEQFWQNLCDGIESTTLFSDAELLAAGITPQLINHPDYVKTRPVLDDIAGFDAPFFGYSPREAELLDPQHRLFLECAWEVLERAGYAPSSYEGLIGVFGGANISSYLHHLLTQAAVVEAFKDLVDGYQISMGMDKDSLTTSVSYKLNLRGPSLAVQTFCSTSLVAVHLACQSLLNGESDMALAGGVSVRVPDHAGHLYQPGGQESPDGHCRAFDAQAQGSVFGDGVGIVVLKRVAEAIEDGDQIYAVIKGSAINNDGSDKVSYSAPGITGQTQVVQAALARAGVTAESIDYIEAHGTGTVLGDPIEIASLIKAFAPATQKKQYCAIGSVKTNIGHLDRAAGVTGLIKTVLALQHEKIPATLHYRLPNPQIHFADSPFYVNDTLRPWPRHSAIARRAGINALGMGGTNAHVILEEAPLLPDVPANRSKHLLLLSARTPTALHQLSKNLLHYLQQEPTSNLADIAYTLQVGRERFEYRRMLVCEDHRDACLKIEAQLTTAQTTQPEMQQNRAVTLLFPGIGEVTAKIAIDLYQQEEIFRAQIDHCCALLEPLLELDLHTFFSTAIDLPWQKTLYAQPLTFIIQYALARQYIHWGIQPQAMFGYSLGEYVAACLADVFSLEDALYLVARRAQLIQRQRPGSMLSVALSEIEVTPYLSPEVSLASIATPHTCVLAGETTLLTSLAHQLQRHSIAASFLTTEHAFHSTLLAPAQSELTLLCQTISLHEPRIPYISNVTGTWITSEQATSPAYWAQHLCQTVQCSKGIETLLQIKEQILLEIGSGQSLTAFVKQHPACSMEQRAYIFSALPMPHEHTTEAHMTLALLGKLWLAGAAPHWTTYYGSEKRRRVQLPTYPFEHQRYWIEAPTPLSTQATQALVTDTLSADPIEALVQQEGSKRPFEDWFYLPSWTRSTLPAPDQLRARIQQQEAVRWLLFVDSHGIGPRVATNLRQLGQEVITVTAGTAFMSLRPDSYVIRPGESSDYAALLRALQFSSRPIAQIIHLWSLDKHSARAAEKYQEHGFYSLLALAQALGTFETTTTQLTVVTHDLFEVIGTERLRLEQATVIGPCKVIPQEHPGLHCRLVDLTHLTHTAKANAAVASTLMTECLAETQDTVVALRGTHRWIQSFEALKLPPAPPAQQVFRPQGVYLITGALGGIALALADFLAHTVHARLALLIRTELPPRARWPDIIAQSDADSGLGSQLGQLLELEAAGAEVLILQGDVSDENQVQAALAQIFKVFGTLHGVFHLAGSPAEGLMQRKTRTMIKAVFAAKVQGTQNLARALQAVSLDFLVLFSSVCSTTGGGPGQIDYSAANAYLDAYAHQAQSSHRQVIALDWGEWQWNAWEKGLMGYPPEMQRYFRLRRQRFGITFAEGMDVLCSLIGSHHSQVIVSPEDFLQMVAGSRTYSVQSITHDVENFRQQHVSETSHYTRPLLGTTYVAPQSELELEIAHIWSTLLGIEQIGTDDNFFELGGHSLIGMQVMTRLRQNFGVDIRLTTLFEAPTISALALAVEMLLIDEIELSFEETEHVYER